MASTKQTTQEPIETQLWKAADKLRKNIDAAEYKHVVLGLVFLKYISDAFEELYEKLTNTEFADPEDPEEYKAEGVFFVPQDARWNALQSQARNPEIGRLLDQAMDSIEKNSPSLKGVLPKVYAKENLDVASVGGLIDLVSNIALGDAASRSADVLGHVFEYFLGEFALAEGKKGGQFYTTRCVVQLLVEMLEPFKGRVMDPCCGSGGMFVQSEQFVTEHSGRISDISIYGQESNQTTWRLCKMNLAIRGIDSTQVKWNAEGSFMNNSHKDVKVDYIIANPPFNQEDWGVDQLRNDARWTFGVPPESNANYGWIQHFLYHLAPGGQAGFVLAKGSMTTTTGTEDEIRRTLVDEGLVDCIVNLPSKLFLNTRIPVCLWFMRKERSRPKTGFRNTDGEILFIDARDSGEMVNRRLRELTEDDISGIAGTYHNWRNEGGDYEDVAGFCASVSVERVAELDYVLTPGRYVGLADEKDDFDFKERFTSLRAEFESQLREEVELNTRILSNLDKIRIDE